MIKTRKCLALLLTVCLLLSLLPTAAFATGTEKAIQLVDKSGATPIAGNIAGAQASNVYFGTYPQSSDGNGGYNDDPIKWRVLQNADGHLLLLADRNLDAVQYNTNDTSVTWETSTMRSWLNGYGSAVNQAGTDYSVSPAASFLGTAFTTGEQAAIPAVTVVNANNPEYGTAGGNNTTDKLFLLSIAEATTTGFGFTDNYSDTDVRKAGNTDYAKSRGIYTYTYSSTGCGDWWLRSPGDNDDNAAVVGGNGNVDRTGFNVDANDVGVRPAFHIDLNSVLFTSAANGGKAGEGALAPVGDYSGSDWKLTLLDDGSQDAVGDGHKDFKAEIVGTDGDPWKWKIQYSGAKAGENEYISAVILEGREEFLYYGRLCKAQADPVDPGAEPNTITVDLSDMPLDDNESSGWYELYLFNEQYNGDYKTDYASGLQLIKVPTIMTIDAETVSVGEDAVIIAYLPDPATGTVTLTVNGTSYTVNIQDRRAVLTLSGLDAGTYTVEASYSGDDAFTGCTASAELTVSPAAPAEVSTWTELQAALSAGGDIVLTADVTPDNPYWANPLDVPSGVTAALDLNGHIVDRGYNADMTDLYGSVFKISGTLTVIDSDPTADHGGAVAYTDPVTGDTVEVTGGVITGGFYEQSGGGVQILGGTFNLEGGSITGNGAGKNGFGAVEGLGGGVYMQSGTFNMSGGAVVGNRAVNKNTMVTNMLGKGGGVYVSDGTFTLSGGTVSGNEAGRCGGGVYLASEYSGHGGSLVSGGATVTGNAVGGADNNVYLEDGGVLSVTDTLTGTVGVTMMTPGVFTNGLSGRGTKENFTSDNAVYGVALIGTEAALLPRETTPTAVFTATGPDSGTLSNVTAGMTYAIDGGTAVAITDTTVDLTGLVPCTITVIQPGNGTTTTDSEAQTITVTKAETPNLTATQPTTIGGTGSIPTTAAHEFSTDGTTWSDCTGETSDLAAGTYYVRVKASGTVLASEAQSISISAFDPAKEPTPSATFTATGPDTGTLSNVAAGMTYAIDGGAAQIVTGTSVDLTGLSPCTITVTQPGNGTTTIDSEAQTITVTKAATPSLTAAQPNTIGGTGSVPTTAAQEFSADGTAWTDCADETTGLAAGTYYVRVKAAGTVLASNTQSITINAYVPGQEITPSACFEASGPDSGTLSGLAEGEEYTLSGAGLGSTGITAETGGVYTIAADVTAGTLSIVKKGNGTTTVDSPAQIIEITKAATPTLTAVQPSAMGGTGSIPTTADHEFSTDGTNWAACTGETTGLAAGTYYIRVKAAGTALTSGAQVITITEFVPTQEQTPAATFTATGPDTGTLKNVTAGMIYAIDGGAAVEITETSVCLIGLAPCTITVLRPGNGTTTIDSIPQTITVTGAAMPTLTAVQPTTMGGTGSIPTTADHELSTDGTNWTACTGETSGLAASIYFIRVKAAWTVLASEAQEITIAAFVPEKEPTPTAAFTATGPDTGTLTNVTAGMTYAIDGGAAVEITGTSVALTGLAPCTVTVIRPGNGTTTIDSDPQTITVTKAATPDTVTAENCSTSANDNGRLIGITAAMEYKSPNAAAWTCGTGGDMTGLAPGIYLVRTAASGTVLASDTQEITVAQFAAPPSNTWEPALVTELNSGTAITSAELNRLIREGKTLTVIAENGAKAVFDTEALNGIAAQITGSLTPEFRAQTWENGEDENAAYALTLTSGGTALDDFGGTVTLTLPYVLGEEEDPKRVAFRKTGEGDSEEKLESAYDPETGSVTVSASGSSGRFLLGYVPFPYKDVPRDSYYYDAVDWADLMGITKGTAPDMFNPNGSCTRAQTVTFLWRAAGCPEPVGTDNPFTDVDEDAYYYKAVMWAAENGITLGTGDGRFDPDGTVTRCQSVTFLYRALGGGAAAGDAFTDVDPEAYYDEAVLWAAENGITLGTGGGKFSPEDDCLRAQIVTFLYRAYCGE